MNSDQKTEEMSSLEKAHSAEKLFKVGNVCQWLAPSIISLIIVSIVYPLTHDNGVLLKELQGADGVRVYSVYDIILKSNHEILAIVIMSLTSAILLYTFCKSTLSVSKAMFALAVAFLCREIHFAGTDKGVYVAVVLIAAWCFLRRENLFKELRERPRLKMMLLTTGTTYFFALLVQRRAFKKILPESYKYLEKWIHIPLEEVSENAAHLCFLICAIVLYKQISCNKFLADRSQS